MRILHLSDTPLSGAPLRLHRLINKYSDCESRYIIWMRRAGHRFYGEGTANCGSTLDELRYLIYEWADVLHYHNRWRRQDVFKALNSAPPNKPSVIHFHSPRDSENFSDEIGSGLPLAVPAQYHPRVYPEATFIVPNVVDIYDGEYTRPKMEYLGIPVISYSPSNTNMRGWDDKSYSVVNPILKRMSLRHEINYHLIHKKPHAEVMLSKRDAWVGIDEISTGSYHLSCLEYLSLGVPCFSGADSLTEKVVKDLTGCSWLPWLNASPGTFERTLRGLIQDIGLIHDKSSSSRSWMETFWPPCNLMRVYLTMYDKL